MFCFATILSVWISNWVRIFSAHLNTQIGTLSKNTRSSSYLILDEGLVSEGDEAWSLRFTRRGDDKSISGWLTVAPRLWRSSNVGLCEVMLVLSGEHRSSCVLPFSLRLSLIGDSGVHNLEARTVKWIISTTQCGNWFLNGKWPNIWQR